VTSDERTPEENEAAQAHLREMVLGHGFGYGVPVRGRTIENRGQPNERAVDEKWLLVTPGADPRTNERLIAMAKHIGRQVDQDSVCSSHTDENTYFLGTTNRGSWTRHSRKPKC
jgi:hypothetical protein